MVKIIKLGRRDYRRRYGPDSAAHASIPPENEPTITFNGGKSSREILHELYHTSYSPRTKEFREGKRDAGYATMDEEVLEELEAVQFSRESKGKGDIPFREIRGIAYSMLTSGESPSSIVSSVRRNMDKLGYTFGKESQSYLYWELRENK